MSTDKTTTVVKHVITQHNNWVNFADGRGSFVAYTYCGVLFDRSRMEGAYGYSDWYHRVAHVCPGCLHVADCQAGHDCVQCQRIWPDSRRAGGSGDG